MRLLITFAILFTACVAAYSQAPIVATTDHIELELQKGIGHLKVLYRSAEHKFQYIEDDAGKPFKFLTLGELFDWMNTQSFEYFIEIPVFTTASSQAYLFKRKA